MDLPKLAIEIDTESYCSIKLVYENAITSKTGNLTSLIEVCRKKTTGQRDEVVDEQYNRVIAAKALKEADDLGKTGRLEEARLTMERAVMDVSTSKSARGH